MSDLPHLKVDGQPTSEAYTYAGGTPQGVTFSLPARNQPAQAQKLGGELRAAASDVTRRRAADVSNHPELIEWQAEGVVLTFFGDPGHELSLEGLERRGAGIYLLGLTPDGDPPSARVFVPEGKLDEFLRLVDGYAASVALTFDVDPAAEESVKSCADPDRGIAFRGPPRTKDGMVRLKFIVPEALVEEFKSILAPQATLVAESRPNEKLVDSITSVRLALVEDFWQDRLPFPEEDEPIWWEVWIRGSRATGQQDYEKFKRLAAIVGISRVSDRFVAFPERVVLHAYCTSRQFSNSIDLLSVLAELRRAKELATDYVNLQAREQRPFIEDLVGRLVLPPPTAPSVCVLDWGVNQGHPLLKPALDENDMHAAVDGWGVADDDENQHGTGMAGIALYGCLTVAMQETGPVRLTHRLESAKIFPPPPDENEAEVYGRVMQDAVLKAHIQAPTRNRAICMTTTADARDGGLPTLWSGAVDDLCAGMLDGAPKLMFISGGNIRDEFHDAEGYRYHESNTVRFGIEDPAQAWNAVTVGAFTQKVMVRENGWEGWQPIAGHGELSPRSRTSIPWPEENHRGWPLKPDIVMEGGNYVEKAGERSGCDDLSMLTTILLRDGRLLTTTRDTSPATALASRMAAQIWSRYPRLWPETVRALMVHSAAWTDEMIDRFPGEQKSVIQRRIRCYGYGVPNLQRALNSAENAVTLIYEGELQPFCKDGSDVVTNEMHVHELPWPKEILEGLGEERVTMRVTLSYFVEPSPQNVGWKVNHRYASHGLRFDVIRPTESEDAFPKRISKALWDNPKVRPQRAGETRNWTVGEDGCTHGSLHSDWWSGTAAQLARSGQIIVYPVTGWWKERPHLAQHDRKARYSLIVSIETTNTDIDLYTPLTVAGAIENEVGV